MKILHQLAVGFKRIFIGRSIPHVSGQKSYGNQGENDFLNDLRASLPEAVIKSHVMVETNKGRCEIDALVRYNNKLFLIEVKHWKGVLIENEGYFISKKEDPYTAEIYTKEVKSPFHQIKRQAYLLKEMTHSNPWLNTLVFFCDCEQVNASDANVWFDDFYQLVEYIKNDGKSSSPEEIDKCLFECKTADYIYASALFGEKNLHCIIDPSSLIFDCSGRKITKDDIKKIKIEHHFSYDDVIIVLKTSEILTTTIENGSIRVLDNGVYHTYALAKIKWIWIGDAS